MAKTEMLSHPQKQKTSPGQNLHILSGNSKWKFEMFRTGSRTTVEYSIAINFRILLLPCNCIMGYPRRIAGGNAMLLRAPEKICFF